MYKIKSGLRLITKQEKSKEKETKYNYIWSCSQGLRETATLRN